MGRKLEDPNIFHILPGIRKLASEWNVWLDSDMKSVRFDKGAHHAGLSVKILEKLIDNEDYAKINELIRRVTAKCP